MPSFSQADITRMNYAVTLKNNLQMALQSDPPASQPETITAVYNFNTSEVSYNYTYPQPTTAASTTTK